jgi:predicted nucleic acid-binding protein
MNFPVMLWSMAAVLLPTSASTVKRPIAVESAEMNFIDTNLIVYANDKRDIEKQAQALDVIRREIREGTGVISIQVMQEYANTALNKLNQEAGIVLRQLALLETLTIIRPDPPMVRRAVELKMLFQLSFWDASILAAAESAACRQLFSEDLNVGQAFGAIRVINPFGKKSGTAYS